MEIVQKIKIDIFNLSFSSRFIENKIKRNRKKVLTILDST
jgi:hypothetical protein